jgi:hypothetical protein
MRLLGLSLCVVLLMGLMSCSAHPGPDDVFVRDLHVAVKHTLTAMAVPEDKRPSGRVLDDQVRLLSCRLNTVRREQLTSGTLDRSAIVEAYADARKRAEAKSSRLNPPTLLTFLMDQQPQWTREQIILAAALLAQWEDEAKLTLPSVKMQ